MEKSDDLDDDTFDTSQLAESAPSAPETDAPPVSLSNDTDDATSGSSTADLATLQAASPTNAVDVATALRPAAAVNAPNAGLSPEDLTHRMQLFSPSLVEEIFRTSKDALVAEAARDTALNAKATALFGTIGLSVTFTVGFGALLLQQWHAIGRLGLCWGAVVLLVYAFTFASGIVTSLRAHDALIVIGEYVGLDEHVVFDAETLSKSDRFDVASRDVVGSQHVTPQHADEPNHRFAKSGTTYFQRIMTVHIWQMYQKHFEIHERKAKQILRSQKAFRVFLYSVGVLGLVLMGTVAMIAWQTAHAP